MPLNANRIDGAKQFLKVEFALPSYEGALEIELQISSQSTLTPEPLTWLHPACY